MLSGGDAADIKTADFFSASRSNNDLKDMLRSARDAKTERQELQTSHTEINFTERTGKGNELRLQKKNSATAEKLIVPVRQSM